MAVYQGKIILVVCTVAVCLFSGGCGERSRPILVRRVELRASTIGSLGEIISPDTVAVEGYGLVGGLGGTGSSDCPSELRAYLKQYILQQLPADKVDPDKLIDSRNTAVVLLRGLMPLSVSKGQRFDVRVVALGGSKTTSLKGGRLFGADLKRAGSGGMVTRTLAKVKGPVFVDTLGPSGAEETSGYVLGGGWVLDDYTVGLALFRADYITADAIRDKLEARFGGGTAKPLSGSQIKLKVPDKYKNRKRRFISLVGATYIAETPEGTSERIIALVVKLASSDDKEQSEIALEAIGAESLTKLAALLNSYNEEVRLRAARCMLNLDDDRALGTLAAIAEDRRSAYRLEALEAITAGARRNDATRIARRLLRDADFDVRLAAYESLRKADDISIMRSVIAGDFWLEEIVQTRHKGVFVSRGSQPRIVLFGAPIYCREDIFVQSRDNEITINARAGAEYVSVIRKLERRVDIPPISLRSSFKLSDIIRTLCESAIVEERSSVRPGLNASYADAIYILSQMCEKGMVEAEFRAGDPPKID
jgi:flagellar basal body P-ring protein FlgI